MDGPDQTHDVELDALYRETVLDHFRSPRGRKPLARVDLAREGYNPVCGDRMTLNLALDGETIAGVSVQTKGCVISVASGSMLAELVPGKTRTEAQQLAEGFRRMMHGEPVPSGIDVGDLDALGGVKNFPVRVKCALLAWMTLLDALRSTDKDNTSGGVTNLEQRGD